MRSHIRERFIATEIDWIARLILQRIARCVQLLCKPRRGLTVPYQHMSMYFHSHGLRFCCHFIRPRKCKDTLVLLQCIRFHLITKGHTIKMIVKEGVLSVARGNIIIARYISEQEVTLVDIFKRNNSL
ncbi:hypothetical protein D3C81_638950 [compost metagenome]